MLKKLLALMATMHPRYFVEFRTETDWETGGESRLVAYLFLSPPEEGWATEGEYFGHPPGASAHKVPCREDWKNEPRVIFGTTEKVAESLLDGLERHRETIRTA